MIIPVSRPQRQLLQNNDVMETFANALDEQDITVEVSTLHTERIAVTRGDPDVAKRCLASVVPAETVKFGVDDDEAISLLQDLRHKFPSGFAVHFGRGMADVAFLPSIRGEVLPVLENVKYARKLVPLPPCLADFVRRHLQCFEADLSREISHPADLSITFDSNNQPFLQLKCDKASIPEAQRVVEKTLALLCITQKDVKRSLGLYLQSPDGRRQAHDIEENSGCAISAMTQDERVLVSARSPGGHQVMVCEGSLETTDCRVLVLPLCDGQTEWTPSQKCILERGCLSADTSTYGPRVGLPPKRQIFPVQCQLIAAGQTQTVIIMYIPPPAHHDFQQCISKAMKDVLQSACAARSGLAFPLKLSADVTCDVICTLLLNAIADEYDDNHLPPMVKVYLDSSTECPDLTAFFRDKGWTCEKKTTDEHYMDRVEVVIGDIFEKKADAVVNSTDPALKHTYGQVAKEMLKRASSQLTDQCQKLYPTGIGNNMVAITDAFGLNQFKKIFHVAMPPAAWDPKKETESLGALRSRVLACLSLASVKELSSIVFPAVATGILGYPAEKEARTVLSATREFFTRMPLSSLKRVTFVCHRGNLEVAKIVKAEGTIFRFAAGRSSDCIQECRFEVKKRLVQVVKAGTLAQPCAAQLLICADPPPTGPVQDYQRQMAEGGCVQTVKRDGKTVKSITDILTKTTASSVQINLQTFDALVVDDVVKGVEKGLENTRAVHIVIMVVPSSDVFKKVRDKLAKSHGHAVGNRESRDQQHAMIAICGQEKDVQNAAAKVEKIVVPDEYQEAEKYNLHQSFIDPPEPAPTVAPAPDQTPPGASGGEPVQQGGDPVTVTIPRDQLKEINRGELIDALEAVNVSISFSHGGAKLRTKLDDFAKANDLVRKTVARLRQFPTAAAPPTVPGQFSSPGQPMTSAATLQRGEGQSADTEYNAGSDRIPSAYLSTQPSSSREFDKNATQYVQQAAGLPDAQADDTSACSGFCLVDRPTDAGNTQSMLSRVPAGQPDGGLQKIDTDPSFVIVCRDTQASAHLSDAARTEETASQGGRQIAGFDDAPAASLETEALTYLLGQDADKAKRDLHSKALRREDIP